MHVLMAPSNLTLDLISEQIVRHGPNMLKDHTGLQEDPAIQGETPTWLCWRILTLEPIEQDAKSIDTLS